jgi:hypothetical protein
VDARDCEKELSEYDRRVSYEPPAYELTLRLRTTVVEGRHLADTFR